MTSKQYKHTEIGEIPKDWEVRPFGELGYLKNGVNFNRSQFGNGYKVINVTNLFSGRFATIDQLNEIIKDAVPNSKEYFVRQGDLLFARSSIKTSGTGQVALVKENYEDTVFSGFIIRFRPNDGVNTLFLNYLLRSSNYRQYFVSNSSTTTITNLNQPFLSSMPIIFPPIDEQNRIADFISVLDDKIELNRRMNKTLEEIGKALFKRWFVDFEFPNDDGKPYKSNGVEIVDIPAGSAGQEFEEIPKEWKIKPLDVIATFFNGVACQKYPPVDESGLPVIKIAELHNGITENSDRASSLIAPEYIVENGDVIFSWSGSLEVVLWTGGKGILNQHLFKVSSENYPKWFYYFWTLKYLPMFREIASDKATTMGHIQRRHLSESLVLVPTAPILEKMNGEMTPLLSKIIANSIEINFLVQIRDSLLPRLMSGKLRLN